MTILYETQATAIGGREGSAASADGRLKVRLDSPKALGGSAGAGTNPEQLFAAGYAACFLSSLKKAAAIERIEIAPDSNVTATVSIGDGDGKPVLSAVVLAIDLPGLDEATAARLADAAHARCPYSRAIEGNIAVTLSVA